MLLPFARKLIGCLILAADKITSPASPNRSAEAQALLDEKTGTLELYEMRACPFCVKVRREVKRLGLNIQRRDIKRQASDMDALLAGGGKFQVPCLRIANGEDVRWLYESDDIIDYLRRL